MTDKQIRDDDEFNGFNECFWEFPTEEEITRMAAWLEKQVEPTLSYVCGRCQKPCTALDTLTFVLPELCQDCHDYLRRVISDKLEIQGIFWSIDRWNAHAFRLNESRENRRDARANYKQKRGL